MTDIPILFAGPMVRALMEGRKTQTRRVIKPQPFVAVTDFKLVGHNTKTGVPEYEARDINDKPLCAFRISDHSVTPYPTIHFAKGDRLWARETHWRHGRWVKNGKTAAGEQKWTFIATPSEKELSVMFTETLDISKAKRRSDIGWHKRPSIYMPRWASRLTLVVTDVRVERVQDISESDAEAEGAEFIREPFASAQKSYRAGFGQLWGSLNAKRGFGWEVNPWVVAVTFTVHKSNIDDLPHPVEQGQ